MAADLVQVIEAITARALADLNTAIPAKILAYNPSTQLADVQPMIKRLYKTGEAVSRAKITGVPVVFPAGGGGIMSFPIKVGDTVLCVFSQRSIDRWVRGNGDEVDPGDYRKHDLSDGMAIPGLFTAQTALQSDPDNVIIKFGGSTITIAPDGAVEINGPVSSIKMSAIGAIDIDTPLTVNVNAASTTITAPLNTVNGNLVVNGLLSAGGITVSTGFGGSGNMTMTGSMTVNGEVTAGGIPLSTHLHSGVDTGPGISGPPV